MCIVMGAALTLPAGLRGGPLYVYNDAITETQVDVVDDTSVQYLPPATAEILESILGSWKTDQSKEEIGLEVTVTSLYRLPDGREFSHVQSQEEKGYVMTWKDEVRCGLDVLAVVLVTESSNLEPHRCQVLIRGNPMEAVRTMLNSLQLPCNAASWERVRAALGMHANFNRVARLDDKAFLRPWSWLHQVEREQMR